MPNNVEHRIGIRDSTVDSKSNDVHLLYDM